MENNNFISVYLPFNGFCCLALFIHMKVYVGIVDPLLQNVWDQNIGTPGFFDRMQWE